MRDGQILGFQVESSLTNRAEMRSPGADDPAGAEMRSPGVNDPAVGGPETDKSSTDNSGSENQHPLKCDWMVRKVVTFGCVYPSLM